MSLLPKLIPRLYIKAAICPSAASLIGWDPFCTLVNAVELSPRVTPSPPERPKAANAEEKMRKNKIAVLSLALMLAMSVSCSRLGAPSDDAIATDIKAKMFSEPALKPATVDVVSKHGEVTLTGQVPDDAARLAAYKIASETKGESRANEQMSVVAAQAEALQPATPATQSAPAKRAAKTKASSQAGRTRQAATEAAVGTPAPPPPPQPVTVTVPANTIVTVRTIDSIDSKANQAGQVFKASLDAPIVADNRVIVPVGADAYIKLVSASSAGHIKGRSELGLELSSIVFQGN